MTERRPARREQIQEKSVGYLVRISTALALAFSLAGLLAGCGCLAANAYEKPACQKYQTDWPLDYYDDDLSNTARWHGSGELFLSEPSAEFAPRQRAMRRR